MAEVINLEQDNLNETTRITVNLVQISTLNSSCDGRVNIAGKFQLCRPINGINIICLMNMRVEYVNYITAGCDSCKTKEIEFDRKNFSSPKPVYGDYMHRALASYGGHILIPQCTKDSVSGCLTNVNSVDEVRDKFVELLRAITTCGVLSRRRLLFGMGIEIPVQILVKGVIGVRLEFKKVYWIIILIMNFLCIGYVFWLYCKDPDFCYKIDQYYRELPNG